MEIDQIYLGNAYELIKQVPDKSVDLIVTDPPYDFGSGGGGGCFGTGARDHAELDIQEKGFRKEDGSHRIRKQSNDEDEDSAENDNIAILPELIRVMKTINIYIWCNKKQIYQYLDFFVKLDCKYDLITWHKTNPLPTINGNYLPDTEYCLYFRGKNAYLGGSYETKRKWYISSLNTQDKEDFAHPTIKPLEIIRNLVINSSKEGDVVLDPFIGSGTTAVACKELGRHYIGFEIEPKYFKIATDRVDGITKKERDSGYQQTKLF